MLPQIIFRVCLLLPLAGFLLVPSTIQAASFGKDNDMVKGAKDNNIGVMERGFIDGASPNSRTREGDPVIILIAEHGNELGIRYLIARGARVNDTGRDSRTALGVAASRGYVDVMKHLIEHGADTEKPGLRREVPIIRAARAGKLEAVKLLIESGAYPDDTDLTGRTALEWAQAGRHQRVVDYLETLR